MKPVPSAIGGAKVLLFTPIDSRHRHTKKCSQVVRGVLQGAAHGLAICQYEDDAGYYLFGCDSDWECVTDTWHETLDDARVQAEFEYEHASQTWQSPTQSFEK